MVPVAKSMHGIIKTMRGSAHVTDSGLVGRKEASGEVPRGEKMLYSGTNPESHMAEYTLVCGSKKMRGLTKSHHSRPSRASLVPGHGCDL